MSVEARFVLAIVLMMAVLVGGNLIFPRGSRAPGEAPGDSASAAGAEGVGAGATGGPADAAPLPTAGAPGPTDPGAVVPSIADTLAPPAEVIPAEPESEIRVEGPLYTVTFSNVGGRIVSVLLPGFESFTRDGAVELIEEGDPGLLGARLVVGADTVDLRSIAMQATPAEGLRLEAGGDSGVLSLRATDPSSGIGYEVAYTFDPDTYIVEVSGSLTGSGRAILMTDLGWGVAYNEVDESTEAREMAYVVNHLQQGIQATQLSDVEAPGAEDGPFLWTASKSRYFVVGLLPPAGGAGEYLGGLVATPAPEREDRARVAVTQAVGDQGFDFRLYVGPQDYALLSAVGSEFQEVSPVGWEWLRPVLRPIVAAIMWVLVFFHENLAIGYGWVLILMGVLMRIVLFPLNHKAMRAQLKNMAVQPLLKDIQTRYKDQPERMQAELMKLYKEHGFNPLGGCWPILLPWPILIALFFVFRNTIELRGVPFAWLPDLAAKDPIYVLPLLLGVSMFVIQWISMRAVADTNPQMKMMLWFMPIFMVVIFVNFPSGLNLYYLSQNVATLPQSWWIAKEREKVQLKQPPAPAAKR